MDLHESIKRRNTLKSQRGHYRVSSERLLAIWSDVINLLRIMGNETAQTTSLLHFCFIQL